MDKAERVERLLPNGRGVWIQIEHGASDFPIPGLTDTEGVIRSLDAAGVYGIVVQKGVGNHYNHPCEGTST